MLLRIVSAIAFAVLGAAVLRSGVAVAAVPTGGLYVATLPSEVDVWVDGAYVGRSPLLVDALAAGPHTVTLVKPGWLLREASVDVPSGDVAMSTYRLAAAPHRGTSLGTYELDVVPPNARVAVDGVPVSSDDRTPRSTVAGEHELTLTMPSGPTTRAFTVVPGTCTHIVLPAVATVTRSQPGVVVAADAYLPADAYAVRGDDVRVNYLGHEAHAKLGDRSVRLDGSDVEYDAAPVVIRGKLYLPLALVQAISAEATK